MLDSEREAQQRAACFEKLTWQSYEEAIGARAYAQWQYGQDAGGPKPYHCKHCDKWHLASSYT